MEIIDFRTRPRTPYFYRDIVPEPIPAFKQYFAMYHMDHRMQLAPLVESVQEMQEAGVTTGVIFGTGLEGCKEVKAACDAHPGAYVGLIDIDVRTQGATRAMEELRAAYEEYDIRGLTLSPFIDGVYATDARYYPLYALSETMGKAVQIHQSTHFNPLTKLDLGDPNQVDQLAVHFPELKIVIGHAGIGFGPLGITVAQRHSNVYIDFTGLRPRYLPPEMVHGINTYLKYKAIFGTNYPSLGYEIAQEWLEVVKPDVQPYFFYKNAARILGINK